MFLLVAFLLANPAVLAEADSLFAYGANHANELQGLAVLERASASEPDDYDLLWRLARAYYSVADGAPANQKISYFSSGIEAGKRAIARKPDAVEGHFWLAAAWGGYCQEKGGLTAFRNVSQVRSEFEVVIRLNDAYEEGTAYMALGEIDRQLPGLFGGDLKRAIATLEHGLKIAPENPELKLALANAYLDARRKNDGIAQLHELVRLELHSPRIEPGRRAQEKAQKLLIRLEK